MPLLSVDQVTKRYGPLVAVNHVSLEARPGRILGLLGPNGAGKTSTIRMITYITVPDEGAIRYDGQVVGPASQAQMGYLPEERGLYKKLKIEEQLLYLAELKGLSRSRAKQQVNYWLDRFEASSWKGKKTEELSKGMQQKIQFIATLLHEPTLLILDEPFGGLDPINSELLKQVILEQKEAGKTILFASHRMEQVEQMCDDICLISQGEIVLEGPLRDIKRRFGRNTVVLEFEGDDAFLDRLAAAGRVQIGMRSHHCVELQLLGEATARDVLDAALADVDQIYRFELIEPPLNEIFVSVVGEQRRRTEPAKPSAVA